MRILFVCGSFLPDRCGVADYLWHLVRELAGRETTSIAILSAAEHRTELPPAVSDFSPNRAVGLSDIITAIRRFKPDIVHVQYPAIRRVPQLMPLLVRRVMRVPVVQTWHEHYVESEQLSWTNLLGIDGLIYVREDFLRRLPRWLAKQVAGIAHGHIPNGSTIPAIALTDDARQSIRERICGGKRVVAFFGFMNPNKGVEKLFDIVDPATQHILLIGELDAATPYRESLRQLIRSERWHGHVTVTGFLPAAQAGELLAAADAVVFPFPTGLGRWNTSVQAALASGSFVLGTSATATRAEYNESLNQCLVPCEDMVALRGSLNEHIGRRRRPDPADPWHQIADAHLQLYGKVLAK